jgi:hypothetical protein
MFPLACKKTARFSPLFVRSPTMAAAAAATAPWAHLPQSPHYTWAQMKCMLAEGSVPWDRQWTLSGMSLLAGEEVWQEALLGACLRQEKPMFAVPEDFKAPLCRGTPTGRMYGFEKRMSFESVPPCLPACLLLPACPFFCAPQTDRLCRSHT